MSIGSFGFSWWGDVIIPVGIIIINSVLKEEEREARKRWEDKKEEVNRKVDAYNKEIQVYVSKKNQDYNFHKMISLHHESVLIADEAYKALQDVKTSIKAIGKMLIAFKDRRTFIENKLRESNSEIDKRALYKELKNIQHLRKSVFLDNDKLKEQKKEFLAKVKYLNNQTRDFKMMIRDKCGVLGENWYKKHHSSNLSEAASQLNISPEIIQSRDEFSPYFPTPGINIRSSFIKEFQYSGRIVPELLVVNEKLYRITNVKPNFVIRKFIIGLNENDEILRIIIEEGDHPDRCPDDGVLDTYNLFKNVKLDNKTLSIIKQMMKTWDFDSSYSKPWFAFEHDGDIICEICPRHNNYKYIWGYKEIEVEKHEIKNKGSLIGYSEYE